MNALPFRKHRNRSGATPGLVAVLSSLSVAGVSGQPSDLEVLFDEDWDLKCAATTFEPGDDFVLIDNLQDHQLRQNTYMRFPGWRTRSSGVANSPSMPTVAYWTAYEAGFYPASQREIVFTEPVSRVSFHYSSPVEVLIEAYDETGFLVQTHRGAANSDASLSTWSPVSLDLGFDAIQLLRFVGEADATAIDDFGYCVLN